MSTSTTSHRFRVNLAVAISANQWTVTSIAESAELSRTHLTNILGGKSCPTVDVASRLASVVGYSLSELCDTAPRKFRRLVTASA